MVPVKHKDPIVQEGAAVLRRVTKPVSKKEFGTPKLHRLIQKMSKILAKEEYGVALAAPQVGEALRLFVVAGKVFKTGEDDNATHPDKVFINPEISRLSRKKKEMSEGCLSIRGKYGSVLRHEKASVKAYDESGKPFIYHGADLIAHIFQHECDHLDGILYTDKATSMRDEPEKSEA